jgi:hypothetical protein
MKLSWLKFAARALVVLLLNICWQCMSVGLGGLGHKEGGEVFAYLREGIAWGWLTVGGLNCLVAANLIYLVVVMLNLKRRQSSTNRR